MSKTNYDNEKEEASLKDFILTIQESAAYLWGKKIWILGSAMLMAVLLIVLTMFQKPIYPADLKFVVEGQSGGAIGGLSGILGSIGMKAGGGKINPYQILEVSKSSAVFEEVLFPQINGESDVTLANKILEIYQLPEKWEEKVPEMKDFRFTNGKITDFDDRSSRAFKSIKGLLVGPKNKPLEALLGISYNEESGIFTISSRTQDEALSLALLQRYFETIKRFFEVNMLSDQTRTRNLLKLKVDSLENLINSKQYAIGRFDDRNIGLISQERGVDRSKLSREVGILTIALGEAIKSFELADYALQDRKPFFVFIDQSYAPLEPIKKSKLIQGILGLILGGFLAVSILIGRKIYHQTMNN